MVDDLHDAQELLAVLASQRKDFAHEEKAVATVLSVAKVLELVHSRTLVEINVAGRFGIVVKWALKRFASPVDSTAQEMLEHIVSASGRLK